MADIDKRKQVEATESNYVLKTHNNNSLNIGPDPYGEKPFVFGGEREVNVHQEILMKHPSSGDTTGLKKSSLKGRANLRSVLGNIRECGRFLESWNVTKRRELSANIRCKREALRVANRAAIPVLWRVINHFEQQLNCTMDIEKRGIDSYRRASDQRHRPPRSRSTPSSKLSSSFSRSMPPQKKLELRWKLELLDAATKGAGVAVEARVARCCHRRSWSYGGN
ncbi:hypothetical protein LWI28_001044 [Acer negundo]|uniref:Uncharacterized protein n=1 Tax=Acer negundo TaxID=4023 RepID=A0AAD5IX39_ACENE|nr:hypothetical protein LWI28_001044 [Acer negundo]